MAVASNISIVLTANTRNFQSGIRGSSVDVDRLRTVAERTGISYRALNSALNRITRSNFDALSPQQKLKQEIAALDFLLKQGAITWDNYAQAVQSATANSDRLQRQESLIGRLTSQLTVFKTVAVGITSARLLGGVFSAFEGAFEFEGQVTKALSVFRNANAQVQASLRQSARDAGGDLSQNASRIEAAQALEQLGRDGQTARSAMLNLVSVLRFAQAAQLDVAEATEIGTDVYTAFELKVGNVIQRSNALRSVFDTIVAGSLLADVTVEELSQSLIKSAPLLKTFGENNKEAFRIATASQLALAEVGRKGFVGGSELEQAFRDLLKTVVTGRDFFEGIVGIELFDNGELKNAIQILREFESVFEGLTDAQRETQLRDFGFQERSLRALRQLLGASDIIEGFDNQLRDVAGTTLELAEQRLTSFEKVTKVVQESFSGFLEVFVVSPIERFSEALLGTNRSAFLILRNLFNLSAAVVTAIGLTKLWTLANARLSISLSGVLGNLNLFLAFGGFRALFASITSFIVSIGPQIAIAAGAFLLFSAQAEAAEARLNLVTRAQQALNDESERFSNIFGDDELNVFAGNRIRALINFREQLRTEIGKARSNGNDFFDDSTRGLFQSDSISPQARRLGIFLPGVATGINDFAFSVRDGQKALEKIRIELNEFEQFNVNRTLALERQVVADYESLGRTFSLTRGELERLTTLQNNIIKNSDTPAERALKRAQDLLSLARAENADGSRVFNIDQIRLRRELGNIVGELGTGFGDSVSKTIANVPAQLRGTSAEFKTAFQVRITEGAGVEENQLKAQLENGAKLEDIITLLQKMVDDGLKVEQTNQQDETIVFETNENFVVE